MGDVRSLSAAVQRLGPPASGPTDADLVGRFAAGRDGEAFALLVRRHGPTVFGVCRRLLRHDQDAEDAFQAVFLVLARRAGAVGRREAVGNWLYGVAVNVARKARTARQRRREVSWASGGREPAGPGARASRPHTGAGGTPALQEQQELAELLDRELAALPDKYRTAVVLCDLGGRTVRDAAAEVGCPAKTLGTRLLRGRALLAGRLTRRGVTLPAAGLAVAVPPRLSGSVLPLAAGRADIPPAVAALTHGVVSVMIPKTAIGMAVLAGGLLVAAGLSLEAKVPAAPARHAVRLAPADPPAWAHFKKVAGDSEASRSLFADMTADPARAALLDRAAADPAVAVKEYAAAVARTKAGRMKALGRFRQGQPVTPEVTAAIQKAIRVEIPPADVLAALFLGSFPPPDNAPDPADVYPALDASFVDLVGGPDKDAARKLFVAWLDRRRDPTAVRYGLEGALHGAVPGAVPAARRWAADPKSGPGVVGAAALVLGNFGTPADDLPRLAKLRADARAYQEAKTIDGVTQTTQVRDVAAAMALHLGGEDFEAYGFPRVEHAGRAGPDPAPFRGVTAFGSEEDRAAGLKQAWEWLDKQPPPQKK